MNTLYLVACGAEQRPLRLPAAQLYTGALFSSAITHARSFAKREEDVYILSPKHGLLSQHHLVDPYELNLDQLDSSARLRLIDAMRRDLPRRPILPLRIIMLAPEEYVTLFRAACVGTRYAKIPIRTPLTHLTTEQQINWLQINHASIECDVDFPPTGNLYASENEQLATAVRTAALWWAKQLMSIAPPPDPTLFANALALELHRTWHQIAATTRGEWPEDITFTLTDQSPEGPITTAFSAIGLNQQEWHKREWPTRPLNATMNFSMGQITTQINDQKTTIFQL
ncbi:hypothetical protein EON83_27540 [bacterium]|nr:MAG: hypothetical protein EON83_27540 [bacterium]